jgi:hypothetical protein
MKIYSIEIQTDLGRRVIQLGAPLDVEPVGDMPPQFRSLTDVLWGLLREVAAQAPSSTTPKAEA